MKKIFSTNKNMEKRWDWIYITQILFIVRPDYQAEFALRQKEKS